MNESERRKQLLLDYIKSEDFSERLKTRLKIQDACSRSEEARIFALAACKKDPIFFIDNFGWIFAAKSELQINGDPNFPFITFDFQKEFINDICKHIDEGQDVIVEKSRDMGVSWLFVYIIMWYWLFDESFSSHIGSYVENMVDNGTVDSLFGKFDYVLDNLPKWFMPKRFNPKKHRQSMKLLNPETFALITGQAPTKNFGKGARKKVIVFDELPAWEYGKEAWDTSADTTSCRIGNGTSQGANFFKALRDGMFGEIDVITLHWRLHPLKDDKWYEFECSRRDAETIARELDISYEGSQVGRVYPQFIQSREFGKFNYDPEGPLYTFWDLGASDNTAIIWFQGTMEDPVIVDAYTNKGKGIEFYVPFITGFIEDETKYTLEDLQIINDHSNWKRPIKNIAGPDANFVHQSYNKSINDVLRSKGINLTVEKGSKDFNPRKEAMRILMRHKIKINENKRTKYMAMCIDNAHYPKVKRGGMDEIKSVLPVHDFTEAYRSALEYGAFYITRGLKEGSRRVVDSIKSRNPFGIRR
jgi:hypothetical protein